MNCWVKKKNIRRCDKGDKSYMYYRDQVSNIEAEVVLWARLHYRMATRLAPTYSQHVLRIQAGMFRGG